jgi:UDP-4-amino-4,6-dideoxy-N-acetyl-beta-L-altrosamine N-acetyltransferase
MAAVYEDDVIYLRNMTKDDTDLIIKWRNSEEVRSRFIYQALFTRQSHEKWIETMVNTGKVVQMIICLKDGDVPVGSVYIRDIDTTHHKGEYGIFIGEAEARGKGIGTRAAKLTAYAFRELSLHRLFLRVFADNVRAIRSYEKAGFVREAYLKDDVCINGKYRDIVLMAVLNHEPAPDNGENA